MFYSPFKNIKNISDISKLQYSDLDVLKSQEECYCVEYKVKYDKDFKEKKLPKSVCAFSNRNGGWLFVGVNNIGVVEDIDLSNISTEGLYSIIASRVHPMPYVSIAILENPDNVGFGVVAFYIKEGKNTPFIANGIVYVRNGNTSDPADRSALDLLIKQGFDYSDLSLKCLDAKENEFAFSDRQYGDNVYIDGTQLAFQGCVNNCQRVALYLQNDGKHYDESIELTIKLPRLCYFNILSFLRRNPNAEYEKLFDAFTELPATSGIVDYLPPRLFGSVATPPLSTPLFDNPKYDLEYMDYLFECKYGDCQIIRETESVYIKIIFKEINPQQKMFLPAMLLCTSSLDCIEYTITSKYSMTLITGKLNRNDKN